MRFVLAFLIAAITDVTGIAVGHVTLIEGEGKLVPGQGPAFRVIALLQR